jgi:hypothetical protein
MKKFGFEIQDNGVIFTTTILARCVANLLVRFGYLIKIFKYCYVTNKKHLI